MRRERNVCVWECVFVCVCVCVRERSAYRKWINNRKTFLCLYPQHPRICIASCSVCVCVCVCVCWKDSCFILFGFVFLSGRSTSFWACRKSAQYQQCVLCGTITHTTSVWKGLLFQRVGGKAHKVRPCCKCVSGCMCVYEMVFFLSGKRHIPSPPAGRLGLTERGFYLFCCVCLFLHRTHTQFSSCPDRIYVYAFSLWYIFSQGN